MFIVQYAPPPIFDSGVRLDSVVIICTRLIRRKIRFKVEIRGTDLFYWDVSRVGHTYVCVCVCVCVCICIYIYIYTYIHIPIYKVFHDLWTSLQEVIF